MDNLIDVKNEESKSQKPTKKRTKPEESKIVQRERVRECEQRRRDRIIGSFESLQGLLPEDKEMRTTKENILLGVRQGTTPLLTTQKAVKYIRDLKNEIEKIKKQKVVQSVRIVADPLNTSPLTEEEIQAGFNAIYIDTMSKLNKVESRSTLSSIEHSAKYLSELASKSISTELCLHANLLEIILGTIVVYNPRQVLPIIEKTLPLVREATSKGKQISFMGGNVEGLLLAITAFVNCSLGHYEKSSFYEQKTLECIKAHPDTAHLAYSSIQHLRYWRSEELSVVEASIIRDNMVKYEGFKAYGNLTFAAAQLRASAQFHEQIEAISIMNNCVVDATAVMGSLLEMAVKTIAIMSYMTIDPERALVDISNLIEKSEKSGVTSVFTKSEFMRIKGEILLLLHGRTIEEHAFYQHEAERHLKAAASLAIDSQCDVSYLKAVMCLCKLFQAQARTTDLVLELASLSRVYIKLTSQNKEKVGLLSQAKHYVDLLTYLIKV